MKHKNIVRLITFLLIVLAATPVLAAPFRQDAPPEFTLSAILLWIATGPGAAYLVGLLVAQVLENIPAWHSLPPQVKFVATLALAGLFPVLAQLLLNWPGLPVVEPWLNTAIAAIVIWIASQKQYRQLKLYAGRYNYGIRNAG